MDKQKNKIVGTGKNFHRIPKKQVKPNKQKSFFEVLVSNLKTVFNDRGFHVVKKREEKGFEIQVPFLSVAELIFISDNLKYRFGNLRSNKKEVTFIITNH